MELPVKLVIVASLETVVVQPVPQPAELVDATLNVITVEWDRDPLVPVTFAV